MFFISISLYANYMKWGCIIILLKCLSMHYTCIYNYIYRKIESCSILCLQSKLMTKMAEFTQTEVSLNKLIQSSRKDIRN
jgi:uncharacterized protein YpmS